MRFERYDDAVYAHTDYVKWLREHGEGYARAWLGDRRSAYGEHAYVPSAVGFQHALVDALAPDICWMTTEMMDLVQAAMEGFNSDEPVTMDDVFIPHGFMVLPHSFMSRDRTDKRIAFRVLCWQAVDELVVRLPEDGTGESRISYTLDAFEGEIEGGVRFHVISYVDDEDDYFFGDLTEALKEEGQLWGILHTTAIPFRSINLQQEIQGEGDMAASWLLFWRVAQKLMAERIVTKETRQPGRAARREAQRFLMPPPLLRVIELRRPRGEGNGDGHEGSSRHYTHRWIVRGHWRNQPYKDGYRQKYIGSYIKGPSDLDLVVKTRVWNWDR